MSGSDYNWADAKTANYVLVERDNAPDELNTPALDDPYATGTVTAPYALFIGADDGVIIQGELDDIVTFIDLVHDHVHRAATQARR